MVKVQNLSFSYGDRRVLKEISFEAQPGQLLSVLGSNGVGKSTLLRCILGLLPEYTGEIEIGGASVRSLRPAQLSRLVACIPQSTDPSFRYSVEDMVLMGCAANLGPLAVPGKREREIARRAMEKLGIYGLRNRCFHHLSGGERQLTVMARALTQQSRVLLLDEPTASLDFGNQIRVLQVMRSLAREGYTVLQTTHNPDQTYLFSDRVLAMKDGQVLSFGTPQEVITSNLMSRMYGVGVRVDSLEQDRARVCLPRDLFG